MKKFTLSAVMATLAIMPMAADVTTVKELYTGEARNVTWENTLSIDASEFTGVTQGDYIYIEFLATTDVIELKSNGTWLPGSRYFVLGTDTKDMKCYITAAGLNYLQTYGLELCGADFTVSSVSVCNDGFNMPANAVWGGFFWISDWNTLEIWKTAFDSYDGERYMEIYLSDDNGDNTNYVVNVRTNWNDDGIIADNTKGNITKTPKCAIVNLDGVNLTQMLESTDRLMIQGNPEGGNPFNFTMVAFSNSDPTGVETIEVETPAIKGVYNLQGICLSVDSNLESLPAGIYIVDGKKVVRK